LLPRFGALMRLTAAYPALHCPYAVRTPPIEHILCLTFSITRAAFWKDHYQDMYFSAERYGVTSDARRHHCLPFAALRKRQAISTPYYSSLLVCLSCLPLNVLVEGWSVAWRANHYCSAVCHIYLHHSPIFICHRRWSSSTAFRAENGPGARTWAWLAWRYGRGHMLCWLPLSPLTSCYLLAVVCRASQRLLL